MAVQIANLPKAWILALGILAVTALMLAGRIPSDSGLPVLTALSGYGIGNGIGAVTSAKAKTPASPHIVEATEE